MTAIQGVPVYKLFGEQAPWPTSDMMHCESIAARSQLHNWQIAPHQHNNLLQLLYLQQGSARIQIDNVQYDMSAQQILVVPQMCIHGFQFAPDALGHVVTLAYPLIHKLTGPAADKLLALTRSSLHFLSDGNQDGYIKTSFQTLDAEYRGTAPYRNLMIETLLGIILIWLARSVTRHALGHGRAMDKAGRHFSGFCQLVEAHYASHRPVSFYAGQLGITTAHLSALCRQIVQKAPLELIHERMILEAKRNLVYTSMTISIVSYTLGFSDPAYFTRVFKRQVGHSPRQFRQRMATRDLPPLPDSRPEPPAPVAEPGP